MAENSSIEWCDHTFNPWIGCTRISPGCDNCYAAVSTPVRTMGLAWGNSEPRHRTLTWSLPKRWNAQHEAFHNIHGRRQRVFCASLADVFDNHVDKQWRVDLFSLIRQTPNLDWLLLTKRIGNAHEMIVDAIEHELDMGADAAFDTVPWPNVWLGATIVNQEEADRDIPKLLATPARVRFLSMEPLLGPVDLDRIARAASDADRAMPGFGQVDRLFRSVLHGQIGVQMADGKEWFGKPAGPCLDWVIVGGESSHGARPMHPDWARSVRDQCAAAGVPFLFKQWGEWLPCETDCGSPGDAYGVADDGSDRELSGRNVMVATLADYQQMARIGKKAAGRLLDGVTHDGFPEVAL